MSTRIYKGFRLKTASLTEALGIIEGFRPWVTAEADMQFDGFMDNVTATGCRAIEAYDLWQARRREVKKTGERDPGVDTDFSVSLMPAGKHLLGIVYTEHDAWFRAWVAHPAVEEFGYWDNADGPEEVPEDEWEERREAWQVLKAGPVSMQSFSIELVNPQGPLPKAWRT